MTESIRDIVTHYICIHATVQVLSSAATAAGRVRRMCFHPGCDYMDELEPDSVLLTWKNRNYGTEFA